LLSKLRVRLLEGPYSRKNRVKKVGATLLASRVRV
jgi:hypothetical protein